MYSVWTVPHGRRCGGLDPAEISAVPSGRTHSRALCSVRERPAETRQLHPAAGAGATCVPTRRRRRRRRCGRRGRARSVRRRSDRGDAADPGARRGGDLRLSVSARRLRLSDRAARSREGSLREVAAQVQHEARGVAGRSEGRGGAGSQALAYSESTGDHGAARRRRRVDQPTSAAAMRTRWEYLVVSWNLTATPPGDASEAWTLEGAFHIPRPGVSGVETRRY